MWSGGGGGTARNSTEKICPFLAEVPLANILIFLCLSFCTDTLHRVILEIMTDCSTVSVHSPSHCEYPVLCKNEERHNVVYIFWVTCHRCIIWCLWFNSPPHLTSLAFFLYLLGSDWKEGTASQALPFSIRSKSCPKKCSLGPRHDEERYRVFGGSFPQFSLPRPCASGLTSHGTCEFATSEVAC